MSAHASLLDVIKQCSLANIEVIKFTGTATDTKVQTFDVDKTLFIEGDLKDPAPEFIGEFGITNLKLLNGLLGFTTFQSEGAAFKVRTRKIDDVVVPDQFEFNGRGSKSIFKLMNAQHVPTQAKIAGIPWDVTITDIDKSKVAEFKKFAGLYAEVDKNFSVRTVDGNLVFSIGQEESSSHFGSMVFAQVDGQFTGELLFPVDKFIMLMGVADKSDTAKLMFTSKGLLGVVTETLYGNYNYYFRQSVRG